MALDFQVQQAPFRLGLAEGQDPHQLPVGTLTTAENAVWRQGGRLEKRYGTANVAATILGGGSVSACSRLFTRGTELCLVDGTNLYAYAPSQTSWRTVDNVPSLGLTSAPLIDPVQGVMSSDSALTGTTLVTAWVTGDPSVGTGSNAYVQVTDTATGGVLMAPVAVTTIGTVIGVRVCIVGTTAVLVMRTTTTANVAAVTVSLTAFTSTAISNLRTDKVAGSLVDACTIGSTFVICYSAGAGSFKLYSYNSALVQQATGGITSEAGSVTYLAIHGASAETLWVGYLQGTNVLLRVAGANSSTLVETVAPTTVEDLSAAGTSAKHIGVCRYNATSCVVVYGTTENPGRLSSASVNTSAALVTGSDRQTYGVRLTSQPFMMGSRCYVFGVNYPDTSSTPAGDFAGSSSAMFELPVSDRGSATYPHPYMACADVLLGGYTQVGAVLPRPQEVSATQTIVSLPYLGTVPNRGVVFRCGLRLVTLTSGASKPADLWRTVTVGGESYMAGGVLSTYDGAAVFDYGFPRSPVNYTSVTSGAGGSIAAGDYLYGFLQEYRAASGMLYRSGVVTLTTPLTTAGATSSNVITLINCNVGNKQSRAAPRYIPQVATYRSTVNGSVYQRLTYDPTYNSTLVAATSRTQTVTDTRADASIDGASTPLSIRPAIYTTGGILDDYAPPASVTMFHHADRLWVLAGDKYTWWYSKAFQDDAGVAPGFHPDFRIVFDAQQVAGATMDDKAIFFSADGVRYMQGTGPAANGQNSDFAAPTPIQSDVGCNTARSVVSMPDGVMFSSDRGIYLLTRGLELVWIGRPIKSTLALYPTITSAVLVPKHNQVRFTATNVAGTGSIVLVYDYVEKQWSTFKYWVGGVYGGLIADACMWNGLYTFASAVGIVSYEDTTTYLDVGTTYVPMTLETSWVSASGPMAFASVRSFALLGESFTNHDLTITVGFDSNTTYQQTASWAAQSVVTTVGIEEPSVTINTRRKCNTIRFKVVDATPTTGAISTGRGPAWNMMAMEVGLKRGLGNAPATKRA